MQNRLNQDMAALLPSAGLPPDAAACVAGLDTLAALDALEAGAWLAEATRLCAHALPRREAVWWACMCARHTAPATLGEPDRDAFNAAKLWVRSQSDADRRTAFAHAQKAGFATPEAWAAVGAFWSGESLAPEGQAAVTPPAHVAASAVAGAVALSAVRDAPDRREARLRQFIASAREIGAGHSGRLPAEVA